MEKMHHMDYECCNPDEQKLKEYMNFMYNPANIHNCAECPERGCSNSSTLPCGQQQCWVIAHCS